MNQAHYPQVKENIPGRYPSDESVLNAAPIPGDSARPLDQGLSDTCTCHAIANAVADQLAEKKIDIDQSSFAQTLVSNNGTIGAVWPDFFDNYHNDIIIMNKKNKEWISVKIKSVREVEKFSHPGKYILAYYTKNEEQSDGTWKWCSYHCVFVQKQSKNCYICVNSWGDKDKYPEVELSRPGNRLWRVRAEVGTAQTRSPESIKPPKNAAENEVHIKLDFIGVKYIEEYKDKSSSKFKEMAKDIEQEVGGIYSNTKEYERTKVVDFWEG